MRFCSPDVSTVITQKNAAYLQIRLLKSTYLVNDAAVMNMSERVLSVHYYKEFSSRSVKYFITLHTNSFTANHVREIGRLSSALFLAHRHRLTERRERVNDSAK